MRNLLEPTRRIEARGKFVSERLIVNKPGCAGGLDGLFVQTLGVEVAAFDAGDLRRDKGVRMIKGRGIELGRLLQLLPVVGNDVEGFLLLPRSESVEDGCQRQGVVEIEVL